MAKKSTYDFKPGSTKLNGLRQAQTPISRLQLKSWIEVLEGRLNDVDELLDKHKIPNRVLVQGGLYAGLQTVARVELLIKKLSKKK